MRTVLFILAGFLAAAAITWMTFTELTVTDYLMVACVFMLGALINELLRGDE